MAQPVGRAPFREKNTQSQGKSGTKAPIKNGPAARGGTLPTAPTRSGGINRATQRGNAPRG